MPLIRIDFIKGRSNPQVTAIGQAVHRALVECFDVPKRDRFQVMTEHAPDYFVYDPAYLNVDRTDGIVLVQVFLSVGRTTEQKQAFYARVTQMLERLEVRPEDVVVVLIENKREDWSFGQGVAHYLVLPKEEWK